jgi:hypothetical protein
MKVLRKSPTGSATALPHSLANIRSKTREKPIIIGISRVHTTKHRGHIWEASHTRFKQSFKIFKCLELVAVQRLFDPIKNVLRCAGAFLE